MELGEANLLLKWPDIGDPGNFSISASASEGADFLSFLQTTSDDVFGAINKVADYLQGTMGNDLFSTKIPLLNKSLADIFGGAVKPLSIGNELVQNISDVINNGTTKSFTVAVTGLSLAEEGVGVGDKVRYNTPSGEVEGTIESVADSAFTIKFDRALSQTPNAANPLPPAPGRSARERTTSTLRDTPLSESFTSWAARQEHSKNRGFCTQNVTA